MNTTAPSCTGRFPLAQRLIGSDMGRLRSGPGLSPYVWTLPGEPPAKVRRFGGRTWVERISGRRPEHSRTCQLADAPRGPRRMSSAQSRTAASTGTSVSPSGVSACSTVTGTVANAVRETRPSRSRLRKVCVSIFCEMPSIGRRSRRTGAAAPPALLPPAASSDPRCDGAPSETGSSSRNVQERFRHKVVTEKCLLADRTLPPLR